MPITLVPTPTPSNGPTKPFAMFSGMTQFDSELQAVGLTKSHFHGWQASRAFRHWVVTCKNGAGMPIDKAAALHTLHGATLQPNGHQGGAVPEDVAEKGAIKFYHATTPAALQAVVSAIRTLKP